MKKFTFMFIGLLFVIGFIGFAETEVAPGVFYNHNLGYAKYCDYNKKVCYYACALDYKTCSAERRRDYRESLFSVENMRNNFEIYEKIQDEYGCVLDYTIIEFYDATSDYTVMRANALENDEYSYYSLNKIDEFGQPIESIEITKLDFEVLFDLVIENKIAKEYVFLRYKELSSKKKKKR